MANGLARWALVASLAAAGSADAASLITTGANVRLRETAAADAAVVAMLPLGTSLESISDADQEGWLEVSSSSSQLRGWVHASLVARVDPGRTLEAAMELMDARLVRKGDGLPARRQLLDFIERTAAPQGDAALAAELELRRLRALQEVLYAIPRNRSRWDTSLKDWIAGRGEQVRYNEPGGNWLLRPDYLKSRHDAHREAPAADEIAWLAVTVNLGGECEGFLVCYLQRIDAVEGEYLRRQPRGRHVDEALAMVRERIDRLMSEQPLPSRLYFSLRDDCGPMQEAIGVLQAAVQGSNAASGPALLSQLRSFTCEHAQSISRPSR